MTLGEGKRKVYMLLDEYSSGGTVTEDADIEKKMADFFDQAQKQMANYKRIVKLYTVPLAEGTTEYAMPSGFNRLYRIWRDGVVTPRRYQWKAGKLVVPETDGAATLEVEYFAIPATLKSDSADDYEFEVAEDAAQVMPYWVAMQHLIVDLVVDYSALLGLYRQQMALVDISLPGGQRHVRNTFYRGSDT